MDIDQLYVMILQGRFYSTMSNSLGLVALLGFILCTLATLFLSAHEPEILVRIRKGLACAWIFVGACLMACIVFASLNSKCPTIEDAKVILTYKAGEKLLTSDEIREAFDKWVLQKDKEAK